MEEYDTEEEKESKIDWGFWVFAVSVMIVPVICLVWSLSVMFEETAVPEGSYDYQTPPVSNYSKKDKNDEEDSGLGNMGQAGLNMTTGRMGVNLGNGLNMDMTTGEIGAGVP